MKDAPYAIIVDGNGAVAERRLIEHGPGAIIAASVKVLSSAVVGGVRTVTMTRPVAGMSSQHYSIPKQPGQINVITAIGNTVALAYHKSRTGATFTLLPSKQASCVCQPTKQAYLTYMDTSTQAYGYDCLDEPRSDMLKHGDGTGRALPNAACQMETYMGGLRCCQHHYFLTDREQASLIPNKTDTYFLKWRYYFQEYTPATPATALTPKAPASHQHLHHWVFLIDADVNDYEEDNFDGSWGQKSIGKITAHLRASDIGLEDVPKAYSKIKPLVMTPHCHAPSCIREEFWDATTGKIICNVTAKYGADYYGSPNATFNEANYVAIPPCIFGNQTGLQYPFSLNPTHNITAVKYFNNTYRHLGQMAQWTGMMVYDTDPYEGARM